MPNRVGGGGGKLSADTSFSAAADQHFVGGGGEKSVANMSSLWSLCDGSFVNEC